MTRILLSEVEAVGNAVLGELAAVGVVVEKLRHHLRWP